MTSERMMDTEKYICPNCNKECDEFPSYPLKDERVCLDCYTDTIDFVYEEFRDGRLFSETERE
jgi:hypothetical protein